jgi:cardiolipin synthase
MTVANKITITRILMIPVFVLMAVYYGRSLQRGQPNEWQRIAAIAVFLLAAASDGLDGYVARRYNQRSRLGVILDPIADKGLLLTGILTLTFSNWDYEFPLWFPVLVITRDVVIVVGALVLHLLVGKLEVKPSWAGKVATATQMGALACVMLQLKLATWPIRIGPWLGEIEFLDIPVFIAGFFTFISGIGYVMEGIRQLQTTGNGNASS